MVKATIPIVCGLIFTFNLAIVPITRETFAQTAATEEGGFETPKALPAKDLLPPELLKGNNYQIEPNVNTNGFENTYFITSDYGPFQVLGDDMVRIRVQEFAAIAHMEEMKKSDQFATAAQKALTTPLVAAGNLITNPVDTITGVPKGAWRYVTGLVEMVRGSRGELEDSAAKELIGFGKAKRQLASSLGVDVYSSNPVLQRELNALAWAAYAGGMTVAGGFMAIRAASTAASLSLTGTSWMERLNKRLLDNSPEDLRQLNRQELAKIGLDGNELDLFLRNPWYSPRHRTVLIEALSGMEKAKNRKKFITLATTAESEQDAFFFQRIAQLLRGYHDTVAPIDEIDIVRSLAVGYSGAKIMMVPLVLDYGWWTAQGSVLAKSLDDAATKVGRTKQLWATGTLSPRLADELQSRKWEVHQQSWAPLYPAKSSSQSGEADKN